MVAYEMAYTPGPYGGPVVLFRATEEPPEAAEDETLGWRHAVQGELTGAPSSGAKHLSECKLDSKPGRAA